MECYDVLGLLRSAINSAPAIALTLLKNEGLCSMIYDLYQIWRFLLFAYVLETI